MSPHRARAALLLFLAPVLLTACRQSSPLERPPAIVADVALTQAANCTDLAQNIQATAVRQMRNQLDQEKNYDSCCGGEVPVSATGGASNNGPTASAPASYSTTNTQVDGVDESDFVKNDGTRIFQLSGQKLFAAKSWPPEELAVAGELDIEGWPTDMFLDGNQVVVFSSIWSGYSGGGVAAARGANRGAEIPSGGGAPIACSLEGYGCFFGLSTAKITLVDVSDLTAPRVTSQIYLPGSSTGARRVGSSIRLVLSDQVRWPAGIQWWPSYDSTIYSNHDLWVAAINELEDINEAIIRSAPLSTWFPDGSRTLADGSKVVVGYQCSDFYLSNAPEQLGLTTVATLDLNHLDAGVSRASIVGEAGIIYATAQRLYLATAHWWWWAEYGQHDWTYVHAFDISDPAKTAYIGSGGIEGHVDDQFSMDDLNGYLRIASSTAVYSPTAAGQVDGFLVGSRLSVLAVEPNKGGAPAGSHLALVGQIESLEDNERLTAMRFTGDTGYAVTFRALDPLVTLDLSDPANPKKVAELTIPGFSTYLQPIDAHHLLAIGEDLPVDSSGVPDYSKRNLQLSLFDVTDLTHPKRTAVQLVGTAWASSEAEWDHHAFNWYQPDATKPGFLAIPFSDWTDTSTNDWWDNFVSDVRIFSADPAGSIAPLGSLGMSDVYISVNDYNWTYWYRPWVRRSVLSTDIGGNTYVYAVSDAGLRVAALGKLDTPIATALYPISQR